MTTATGKFSSGTSGLSIVAPKRPEYRVLPGSTSTSMMEGDLPVFPSLSIAPPRNGEQAPYILVVVPPRNREEGLESNPEIAAKSSLSASWDYPEADSSVWRGIFSPSYPRKVLFSQQVEIRTANLPRWKPYITIDRRTLERAEDD